MKQINADDLLIDGRATLQETIASKHITALYLLNDRPTDEKADKLGKKTLLLLAQGATSSYLIMSTPATKNKPDSAVVWLADGLTAGEVAGVPSQYIIIRKDKVGRRARQTTPDEVQEIMERHNKGEGVNRIATAMKLGTRRVMQAIAEQERKEK